MKENYILALCVPVECLFAAKVKFYGSGYYTGQHLHFNWTIHKNQKIERIANRYFKRKARQQVGLGDDELQEIIHKSLNKFLRFKRCKCFSEANNYESAKSLFVGLVIKEREKSSQQILDEYGDYATE